MKLNNILKLGSLGLVSLGLVSTVALSTTSCGESLVSEITLTGDFWQGRSFEFATANVKIKDLVELHANDVSTTVVTDAATMASFLAEGEETATISVEGNADEVGGVEYGVSMAHPKIGKYKLNGFYTYSNGDSIKYHMLIVKIEIVPTPDTN